MWASTTKNRPSQHRYKSPEQFLRISYFETSERKALNARWALPVYPIFEDEK